MTITATQPVVSAPPRDLGAKLVLARLLVPAKRPPTPNAIRKDVGKVLGSVPSTETTQDWIDSLRSAGLLTDKIALSAAGQREAMAFLGAEELPNGIKWAAILARYLVPRALGIEPTDEAATKMVAREEALAGLLLKRRYSLPPSTGASLNNVLEALVCQKLGYADDSTLEGVKTRKIAELLRSPKRLTTKEAKKNAPRVLLETNKGGIGALREVVLREWALRECGDPRPGPQQSDVFDLDAFARTVEAVARTCPTGWFGDNKVFISHVYRHLGNEPAFVGMSIDAFKSRLVEANRSDLLRLSRADLVSVMDPNDVKASETKQLNAVFHFIFVEKERS